MLIGCVSVIRITAETSRIDAKDVKLPAQDEISFPLGIILEEKLPSSIILNIMRLLSIDFPKYSFYIFRIYISIQ